MTSESVFLRPVLTGKRFDDHSIPLELMEDFAAFEELLVELAKHLYFDEHAGRKRVPRGFTRTVSLKLSGVEKGSAIPTILLATSLNLFPADGHHYFEKAKENIIRSIDAAERGQNITQFIPENLLGYFNRIGRKLRDDEAISFSVGEIHDAKLNKETRKRLILASSKAADFTIETTLRGFISEVDKVDRSFTIDLINGERIRSPFEDQHARTVFEAFGNHEEKLAVLLTGVGKFNRSERLDSFESLEHIVILDPLDIPFRLEEIAQLKDGWLNGEGRALKREDLDWLSEKFETLYTNTLPLPYLFPTLNGGIQAEWSDKLYETSLNIDFETKKGIYQSLNLKDDQVVDLVLDLNEDNDWDKLNEQLTPILAKDEY